MAYHRQNWLARDCVKRSVWCQPGALISSQLFRPSTDSLRDGKREKSMDVTKLLTFAVQGGASDVHLGSGQPPLIRLHGDTKKFDHPPLSRDKVNHDERRGRRRQGRVQDQRRRQEAASVVDRYTLNLSKPAPGTSNTISQKSLVADSALHS